MPARRFAVLGAVFSTGLLVGAIAVYVATRPAPATQSPRTAGLGGANYGQAEGSYVDGAGMRFRGGWDDYYYQAGDVVTYDGVAYVAAEDHEGYSPPDYPWVALAKGVQGPIGPQGPAGPQGPQGANGPAGAAFGSNGWQVKLGSPFTVPPTNARYPTAGSRVACNSAERIVSGGWFLSVPADVVVVSSRIRGTTGLGGTYEADFMNKTGSNVDVTLYAVCVVP